MTLRRTHCRPLEIGLGFTSVGEARSIQMRTVVPRDHLLGVARVGAAFRQDRLGLGMECHHRQGYPADFGAFPNGSPKGAEGLLPSASDATKSAALPGGVEMARSRAGSPTRATRYSPLYLNILTGYPALP